MPKENPSMIKNEEQVEKILKELTKRGLELELQSYLKFKKRNWSATVQGTFWDIPETKQDPSLVESLKRQWEGETEPVYRTIDLIAAKSVKTELEKFPQITIRAVIECKWRQKDNWIFYQEVLEHELTERLLQTLFDEFAKLGYQVPSDLIEVMSIHETSFFTSVDRKTYKDLLSSDMAKGIQGASHHSRKNLKSAALLHMSVFGSPNPDSIRDACEQVLDALDFQKKIWNQVTKYSMDSAGGFNIWRLYPVIIFNGPIWKLFMDSDGSLLPVQVDYVTYRYRRGTSTYLIDIVSYPHLDSYIDLLETELTKMKDRISSRKD